MECKFSTSSYYLLGLPVSSSQSELKKRARLISLQLSQGDEDILNDTPLITAERNEDTLKDAVQRLSVPSKKIQEVYFWYSDTDSGELNKVLRDGDFDLAYSYLSQKSEQKLKWNAKRDFAIFLTQLLFYQKEKKKYLKESLKLWQELLTSESAWKYFTLYYKNLDDQQADELVFVEFRKIADQIVSDYYSQLSERWDDPEYTQQYTKVFGKIGSHAQKNVVTPSTKEINTGIAELTSIIWSEESLSKQNLDDIKRGVGSIQNGLNILIEAGLYESDESVILREKASDAIRGVAIELTNRYEEYERSKKLLAIAGDISGTDATKSRTENDQNTVTDNLVAQKLQVPVLALINQGNFLQAVEYVERQMYLCKKDSKVLKQLEVQYAAVLARYISESRSAAMEKIKQGQFDIASSMFTDLRGYIYSHIEPFELNQEAIVKMVEEIDEKTAVITSSVFEELNEEREELVKKLFEKLGETASATVLMCLVDCAYYAPICMFLKIKSAKNNNLNLLFQIGGWTILLYGIGLLLLIPAFIWQQMEVKYVRT